MNQSFELFGVVLKRRLDSQRDGQEFDASYQGVQRLIFVASADSLRMGEREALKDAIVKFKEECKC